MNPCFFPNLQTATFEKTATLPHREIVIYDTKLFTAVCAKLVQITLFSKQVTHHSTLHVLQPQPSKHHYLLIFPK